MSEIHSQEIDPNAKCVKDLYTNKDTLNIVFRRATCDSIFFYKIQIYNTDKGLYNKMFVDLNIKQPKKCYDLTHHNVRKLNFKELCKTDAPVIDYKALSEYEKKIRNSGTKTKSHLTIYIYSKNKEFISKNVNSLDLYNQIRNHIACILIDRDAKSSGY